MCVLHHIQSSVTPISSFSLQPKSGRFYAVNVFSQALWYVDKVSGSENSFFLKTMGDTADKVLNQQVVVFL